MNAIPSFDPVLSRAPFDAARDAVAAWRGRCLDIFARSEAAVSETLLVLAADQKRGATIRLQQLVGQRYAVLLKAISSEGAFATDAQTAARAVAQFQTHDALRVVLAHGTFAVTLDYRGCWHLVARLLAFGANQEKRDLFVIEQDMAADRLATLEGDGSRLRSALGQLRGTLRVA